MRMPDRDFSEGVVWLQPDYWVRDVVAMMSITITPAWLSPQFGAQKKKVQSFLGSGNSASESFLGRGTRVTAVMSTIATFHLYDD